MRSRKVSSNMECWASWGTSMDRDSMSCSSWGAYVAPKLPVVLLENYGNSRGVIQSESLPTKNMGKPALSSTQLWCGCLMGQPAAVSQRIPWGGSDCASAPCRSPGSTRHSMRQPQGRSDPNVTESCLRRAGVAVDIPNVLDAL